MISLEEIKRDCILDIQVLVATMHQTDHSLPEKMNIQTDAIIGNQCDRNSIEEFEFQGHQIKFLNFSERGVGLNRNNALMRANAEICLFADDDLVYFDDYVDTIQSGFLLHPDADVLIFNIKEKNPTRYIISKDHRVFWHNYMRYGAVRIAVRLKSIKENAVYFNQCFGGGTEHGSGEDTLFLTECLRRRLKIYAVPKYIASLTDERDSTWFTGYDEKYFRDKGALYRAISRKWWKLLCIQDVLRHRKKYHMKCLHALHLMHE